MHLVARLRWRVGTGASGRTLNIDVGNVRGSLKDDSIRRNTGRFLHCGSKTIAGVGRKILTKKRWQEFPPTPTVWRMAGSDAMIPPTATKGVIMPIRTAASQTVKRSWVKPKTKQRKRKLEGSSEDCLCKAFATAEKYNMQPLVSEILNDGRFSIKDLPSDFYGASNLQTTDSSVIENPAFPGEMYIFRDGAIIFWNIKNGIARHFLRITRNHAMKAYSSHLINWECEEIAYGYEPGPSILQKEKFSLSCESSQKDLALDMFALSNALAVSVKLAHWEHSLDGLITSIESVPEELIKGRKLKYQTPAAVLRKIGEILLIRHRVNLQYNVLDVPDTYWDHENLETLYTSTTRFLNINRRVHLMNEKLTYCAHMAELLKTDLHEKRSLRVEILIVILIFIEASAPSTVMHRY